MSLASGLVEQFSEEAALTRAVLEAVPEDMLAWKPHQLSMTLGQLSGHIVETPLWARSILECDFDVSVPREGNVYVATSKECMLTDYDAYVGAFKEALDGCEDALLSEAWAMRSGDRVLTSSSRHVALRKMTVNHLIHHRGQLSVYLRLLHVAVPSTYGPTADSLAW